MKIIAIAGGGRHMGKSTLAALIAGLLPGSTVVKLGTHAPNPHKPVLVMPVGTRLFEVLEKVGEPKFLILESGSILGDPNLDAELVSFLGALDGGHDKPGSERRKAAAHLVRGEPIDQARAAELSSKLGVELAIFRKLAEAAGVPIR